MSPQCPSLVQRRYILLSRHSRGVVIATPTSKSDGMHPYRFLPSAAWSRCRAIYLTAEISRPRVLQRGSLPRWRSALKRDPRPTERVQRLDRSGQARQSLFGTTKPCFAADGSHSEDRQTAG